MARFALDKPHTGILQIVAAYSLFGGLWIYLSDSFLGLVISDPTVITRLSMYKGLLFIVLTAALLYVLIARYARQIRFYISEISQAQLLMSRQKTLLDLVVEGTPDAVYVKDLAGCYLLANSAVASFVRMPVSGIIGHDDTHLFPPDEAQALMARDRWVMSQSGPQTYEEHVTTPDGERFFLSTKGPVFDADGRVTGLFGVARDITERRLTEEALAKSEEKFSKAFNENPEAMAITIIENGKYLEVNKAFLRITGLDKTDVVGRTSIELDFWLDPDDRRRFMEILATDGTIRNFEVKFRVRDDVIRDFLVSSELIEIDGRQCSLNFIKDITERKQMETTLRESEFFFKESQRAARIGSYFADFPHDSWTSSETLDIIFGIDRNYARTIQGWLDIVHPDDRVRMSTYLNEEVITKKKPFEQEYRIMRRSDGQTRWVSGLGEAAFDTGGSIVSLAGTIRDITDLKQAEEEKIAIEKQLHHAQKLESLGVLAGEIAHDFNNLLAVIIGHCSLVRMKPVSVETHIRQIESAADQAAGLCRQMLTYAGKSPFVRSKVRIDELVAEMLAMLRSSIARNVVITPDISADLPAVTGDDSQIRQIVMNLVINASEAIGTEQGEIRVSLTRMSIDSGLSAEDYRGHAIPAGDYLCLEVTDNGNGMDDETKQRIFEPFYTTKFTGRGLGMSTVLGIIRTHEGALQLFSRPGSGTTFKVFLPVIPAETTVTRQPAPAALSTAWKGSGTVLLAEDEKQVTMIARTMLESLGYTVIEARNGREALDLFIKNRKEISLVFTDIGMPVMDGYEFIRELKKIAPDLPVIISSGFGDADVSARTAGVTIAGRAGKPYNFEELREVFKNVTAAAPTPPQNS